MFLWTSWTITDVMGHLAILYFLFAILWLAIWGYSLWHTKEKSPDKPAEGGKAESEAMPLGFRSSYLIHRTLIDE